MKASDRRAAEVWLPLSSGGRDEEKTCSAIVVVAIILLLASVAGAQSVSFPLEGYYRSGQYMPLRIGGAGDVHVTGDGVMPTDANAGIVPVLIWDEKAAEMFEINGKPQQLALRPMLPDEVLVGLLTDSSLPEGIFGERRVVTVKLDPADFTGEPSPLAWDALDGICFNTPPTDVAARRLLGCGVTLIATIRPGNSTLAWRADCGVWRLDAFAGGPAGARANGDLYEPTYDWQPGRPAIVRRLAVLAAVVVVLGATGCALWRDRRAVYVIVAFSALATAGIYVWPALRVTRAQAGGVVRVGPADGAARDDRYTYFLDPRGGEVSVTSNALIYPLVSSPAHRVTLAPRLRIDDRGATLTMTLTPRSRAGVLTREVIDAGAAPRWDHEPLSMTNFAHALYGRRTFETPTPGVVRVK